MKSHRPSVNARAFSENASHLSTEAQLQGLFKLCLTDNNLHSEAPRSWIESGQCPTPTPKSECPPVVLPVERKISLNSVVFFDELREPLP